MKRALLHLLILSYGFGQLEAFVSVSVAPRRASWLTSTNDDDESSSEHAEPHLNGVDSSKYPDNEEEEEEVEEIFKMMAHEKPEEPTNRQFSTVRPTPNKFDRSNVIDRDPLPKHHAIQQPAGLLCDDHEHCVQDETTSLLPHRGRHRKRVLILCTGGTLTMSNDPTQGNSLAPVQGALTSYLASMRELTDDPEMPEIVSHEYAPLIDSSDMGPGDWVREVVCCLLEGAMTLLVTMAITHHLVLFCLIITCAGCFHTGSRRLGYCSELLPL